MKLKVEWTDGKKFHLLGVVDLELPPNEGWYPMPKDADAWKALKEQYPNLVELIPLYTSRGVTYRRGVCFTPVR